MPNLVERFLRYAKINTSSDDATATVPSTPNQWLLARLLEAELKTLGLQNVVVTDHCFVHAMLPANVPRSAPKIGLVAHLDTTPTFNGCDVSPQIHRNYQGEILQLKNDGSINLDPLVFPILNRYHGHDLITSDGNSLLGADGKAGIAAIMTLLERLVYNPTLPHGDLHIAFTPDEETDRGGIDAMDLSLFPVDFAITMDGDGIGEVNFENFNAAHALVEFHGLSIHPGEGKGKMINAARIAAEWVSLLPPEQTPEQTEDYEGYFHIETMQGSVGHAHLYCLIRDFASESLMQRKGLLHQITTSLNAKYGPKTVTMAIRDDYVNMKSALENKPQLISGILTAIQNAELLPKVVPIRGGSDGAWLAAKGIPTPNLFIGGHNFHGPYEFVSIQGMESAVKALENILEIFSSEKTPWPTTNNTPSLTQS